MVPTERRGALTVPPNRLDPATALNLLVIGQPTFVSPKDRAPAHGRVGYPGRGMFMAAVSSETAPMSNETPPRDWCQLLGIARPKLDTVVGHTDANTYALLITALLERGAPMTLSEVAERFEAAGVAHRDTALASLKRCRPARAPVYRDGDTYGLDPYDDELDLWTFRLGLRGPKIPLPPREAPPPPPPRPAPEVPLTTEELDLAWTDASLHSPWSAQRLALAVLDANGGPMSPADVVAAVTTRSKWHALHADPSRFAYGNSPITLLPDGRWAIRPEGLEQVLKAREAVRDAAEKARARAATRFDPAAYAERQAAFEALRRSHAAELARLGRAVLVVYPPKKPIAAVLVDDSKHTLETFMGEPALAALRARLPAYDVIAAEDVRGVLRALGHDPGEQRLHDLAPPQKQITVSPRGRTVKITREMIAKSSCGHSRPFTAPDKLDRHIARRDHDALRRALESDACSWHALYEYGRLHHWVRLVVGRLEAQLPVGWAHGDELWLNDLKKAALAGDIPLEIVCDAPGPWDDPWAKAFRVTVHPGDTAWDSYVLDPHGYGVEDGDILRARLAVVRH